MACKRSPVRARLAPLFRSYAAKTLLLASTGARVVLPEPEGVALGVLADGEPAHPRHRLHLLGFAADLPHTGCGGVDVVGVEVDTDTLLAALRRVDGSA